jgi:hypothetical protein
VALSDGKHYIAAVITHAAVFNAQLNHLLLRKLSVVCLKGYYTTHVHGNKCACCPSNHPVHLPCLNKKNKMSPL